MELHKDLMYYVTKEEYLQILEFILCEYMKLYEKAHDNYKYYNQDHIRKEEMKNNNICWYRETKAGKYYYLSRDILEDIIKTNDKINFMGKCNINNINFNSKCEEEMKNVLMYLDKHNDIQIKVVEE